MVERFLRERSLQITKRGIERIERIAHPQAKIGRHLVIARAGGVQPAGRWADSLRQTGLDIHVDIFQGGSEGKIAGAHVLADRQQPFGDSLRAGRIENARGRKHLAMGEGSLYILLCKALIKPDRRVYLLHDRCRALLEATTPHFIGQGNPPCCQTLLHPRPGCVA